MSKRLSSKDFLELATCLRQAGPKVKYKTPDAWRSHFTNCLVPEELFY